MAFAIVRRPGPELTGCELTHLERQAIDFSVALAQHAGYVAELRQAGLAVVELPSDPESPDGVFVEDIVIALDEIAVVTVPTKSRLNERAAVVETVRAYRPLVALPKGRLEGGDVLRIGRTLYVGVSTRTTKTGVESLASIVRAYGYRVVPVRVDGCLHLKAGASATDEETLLINRAWVDAAAFQNLQLVDVPGDEPFGANVLRLPDRVLASRSHPATGDLLRARGVKVASIDVSEFHKAEAGLTCMSVVFV